MAKIVHMPMFPICLWILFYQDSLCPNFLNNPTLTMTFAQELDSSTASSSILTPPILPIETIEDKRLMVEDDRDINHTEQKPLPQESKTGTDYWRYYDYDEGQDLSFDEDFLHGCSHSFLLTPLTTYRSKNMEDYI